jgi:hypothetical protein
VSTDIAGGKGDSDGWAASRELAQHVHDGTDLDGFVYRSRLTGANCVAVFDRAVTSKLEAGPARTLPETASLPAALASLSVELIV